MSAGAAATAEPEETIMKVGKRKTTPAARILESQDAEEAGTQSRSEARPRFQEASVAPTRRGTSRSPTLVQSR
jgi:hypothetical protein